MSARSLRARPSALRASCLTLKFGSAISTAHARPGTGSRRTFRPSAPCPNAAAASRTRSASAVECLRREVISLSADVSPRGGAAQTRERGHRRPCASGGRVPAFAGLARFLLLRQHDGRLLAGSDAAEEIADGLVLLGGEGGGEVDELARVEQVAVLHLV